jgi:hypothetical protein
MWSGVNSDLQILSRAHFKQQEKPFACLQRLMQGDDVRMFGERKMYCGLEHLNVQRFFLEMFLGQAFQG